MLVSFKKQRKLIIYYAQRMLYLAQQGLFFVTDEN